MGNFIFLSKKLESNHFLPKNIIEKCHVSNSKEEQRPLDCQFRCIVFKPISLFVNYVVDGNRKKMFL